MLVKRDIPNYCNASLKQPNHTYDPSGIITGITGSKVAPRQAPRPIPLKRSCALADSKPHRNWWQAPEGILPPYKIWLTFLTGRTGQTWPKGNLTRRQGWHKLYVTGLVQVHAVLIMDRGRLGKIFLTQPCASSRRELLQVWNYFKISQLPT